MRQPFSCVLLDLDGTVVDSAPGIIGSLRLTLGELGYPIPEAERLLHFIGPPIQEAFQFVAGMTEQQATDAIVTYRKHYRGGGVLEATVYEGVAEALAEIAARFPLALATSKPESSARIVLEHFGLTRYFTEICGASEDESRSHKADVVEEALRRLRADGVDLSRPVMVGDRMHDVLGAAAHDVPTIRVLWGYGEESESVGTIATAETPAELLALLEEGALVEEAG